jgi:hypothetical protein
MEQYKVLLKLLTQARQGLDYAQVAVKYSPARAGIMNSFRDSENKIAKELRELYETMTEQELAEADEYVKAGEYQTL